jgi:hypothetical protein
MHSVFSRFCGPVNKAIDEMTRIDKGNVALLERLLEVCSRSEIDNTPVESINPSLPRDEVKHSFVPNEQR